ncbi:MAG: hypothetical protein GY784_07935 [Gammaproteobacteria bacterium]|nr:hypothetical protein [Gammaproteobacteria bacterium]
MTDTSALSFERAPSLWTPLRFFLTVPAFAMLAALLMLFDGAELFQSRWLPATLAVTHLLTLGFITMAMLGALFQMLPVVMGVMIVNTNRIAKISHFSFTLGTVVLVAGLWLSHQNLLTVGMLLVTVTVTLLVSTMFWAIFKTVKFKNTLKVVQLALLGLTITVGIGAYLVSGYSFENILVDRSLTNIHAGWGIAGWIIILVIGISEQVLPMFLSTKPYPTSFNLRFAYLLLFLLCAISLLPWPLSDQLAMITASIIVVSYCAKTLHMLYRRHSRRFDIVVRFWQLSLISLLLAVVLFLAHNIAGTLAGGDASVLIGVIVIIGFACSVINGMLYKIVPFLVWLHLRLPVMSGKVSPGEKSNTPNISKVINKKSMLVQFWLHLLATTLCCISAVFKGYWVYFAASVFFASNALLFVNFILAIKLYNQHK